VYRHPHGRVFHTPEMYQIFERTKRCKPDLWAAVDGSHGPVALMTPVQIALREGLLRRFTSRAVAYASVLCAPVPEAPQALDALLQAYKQETGKSILFTELRKLDDLSHLQPTLCENGFAFEDHLNFLIDLARPLDEIWQQVRSGARRNVRRARRSEVTIETIDNIDQIPRVYALLRAVYRRLQVPLPDISFFQSSFEILYPRGMFRILVAKARDVDIGALTLLLYKDIVIYWYTGTLREFSSHRAADFLVWYALQWGHDHRFRVFDFGGAGKPDEQYGVRDFKAKFGGDLVCYGRNTCVHAPLGLAVSKVGYQLYRRLVHLRP
jgi:serine/alanine adding enzyme